MLKKIITLIYVIAALAWSFYAITAELQPALFWIDLFAPEQGDTYPVTLVFLLTFLMFLFPLILLMIISRRIRKKQDSKQAADGPGIWITRKKQLQSALVAVPVYINGVKAGTIDSGTIKFFPAPEGSNTISIGKGMSASEKQEFTCSAAEQPYFTLEIVQSGLIVKYVLSPLIAG
ncbi:MAG: hypothetical protein ACJ77K_12020 [Bacteroidia bacterium]